MKIQLKSFRRNTLPPPGARVEVLCSHETRLEVLPFLCSWSEDGWVISDTRRRVQFDVVGWRPALKMLPRHR